MIPPKSANSLNQGTDFENWEKEKEDSAIDRITIRIWDVTKSILNVCGSVIIISYLLSSPHCMLREEVGRSHLVAALLAGAGISHVVLEMFSSKLRVSGATRLGYVICTLMFLNQEKLLCPGSGDMYAMGVMERTLKWQQRVHMVQGAVVVACVFQILIGLLGTDFLTKFIRPVSIAPTMLLISIFVIKTTAVSMAITCWNSFLFTCFVMFVSYCIANHFLRSREDISCKNLNLRYRLYIGVISVMIVWVICAVSSLFDIFRMKSAARTDVYTGVLNYASFLRVSYPFSLGTPELTADGIFIVLIASFVSVFEILANYYKSSTKTDLLEKPKEEQNKRTWDALIIWEATFCLLTSTMGTALGVDISLKKKEQPFFGFIVGVALTLIALSGKLCSLFVMIPEPVVAALIFLVFMSVFFEGLDMLRCVDMKLTRNLYIFGASLFLGFVIPAFATKGEKLKAITGESTVDEILICLLSTEFFVAGFVAVVLDNVTEACLPKKKCEISVSEKNWNNEEKLYVDGSIGVCDCLPTICV